MSAAAERERFDRIAAQAEALGFGLLAQWAEDGPRYVLFRLAAARTARSLAEAEALLDDVRRLKRGASAGGAP